MKLETKLLYLQYWHIKRTVKLEKPYDVRTLTWRSPIGVSVTLSVSGNFPKRYSMSIPNCRKKTNFISFIKYWNTTIKQPVSSRKVATCVPQSPTWFLPRDWDSTVAPIISVSLPPNHKRDVVIAWQSFFYRLWAERNNPPLDSNQAWPRLIDPPIHLQSPSHEDSFVSEANNLHVEEWMLFLLPKIGEKLKKVKAT